MLLCRCDRAWWVHLPAASRPLALWEGCGGTCRPCCKSKVVRRDNRHDAWQRNPDIPMRGRVVPHSSSSELSVLCGCSVSSMMIEVKVVHGAGQAVGSGSQYDEGHCRMTCLFPVQGSAKRRNGSQ